MSDLDTESNNMDSNDNNININTINISGDLSDINETEMENIDELLSREPRRSDLKIQMINMTLPDPVDIYGRNKKSIGLRHAGSTPPPTNAINTNFDEELKQLNDNNDSTEDELSPQILSNDLDMNIISGVIISIYISICIYIYYIVIL